MTARRPSARWAASTNTVLIAGLIVAAAEEIAADVVIITVAAADAAATVDVVVLAVADVAGAAAAMAVAIAKQSSLTNLKGIEETRCLSFLLMQVQPLADDVHGGGAL